MKNLRITFLFSAFCAYFLIACGGNQQATTTKTDSTSTTQIEEIKKEENKPADSVATLAELPGKGTYATYCTVCHQMDGKGVPNMYPPLANKDWVGGDKTRLIKIVLNGLSEPITVNGEKYNAVMASHDFLSDKQIADVLSYVRKSFGNDYEAITEAEVSEVRKNNKK
ncbi:MAG: cytochrome c [Thermoflexibacter sp.]|jgi:mono/diheme cytochrome c family protein|nr:cytochrome c [Thermoflexibacter sp.]